MPVAQGDLLNGRYRIIEVLGHGGMGSVYRAHDESLDVDVAVKENLFTTEDYARQFRLEATILASLRHMNLPRVSDHFVLPDEGQYLVMDYIEGPDLRQILEKNGPISEEEGIRVGAAICDALTFLHTRNPAVLHRDIKLGNIKLVPDGHICLVDFGLAKLIEGDQPTMTGARAMTPGYSPPEQYGSSRTDARSDVYSLGATLYAALTGFIPEDSLARALDGLELTPIRKRNPKISERLASVIEKAMETSAPNRFQSAYEFKQALLGTENATLPPAGSQPAQPNDQKFPANSSKKSAKAARASWLRPLLLLGLVGLLTLAGLIYTRPELAPFGAPPTSTPTVTVPLANSPIAAAVSTASATPSSTPSPLPPASATRTATRAPISTSTNIPLPTALGGGTGKIAFVTQREGMAQIYTMNPDGSDQKQLFFEAAGACQPRWSPDGTKLAYISPCNARKTEYSNASILIYNLQTGTHQGIASEPGGDFDPAWSPDGKQLVFTSLRVGMPLNPYAQIFKIDLTENAQAVRLTSTESTQPARQPAWSPDGKSILYSLTRNGLGRLWSMNADGQNLVQFLRSGPNVNDTMPAWAYNGQLIYFTQLANLDASGNLTAQLVSYNLETEELTTLPEFRLVRDARPSPDGRWLVAEGTDGSNIDIYLIDTLSNQIQPLTSNPAVDFDPDWQP
ncbi:MAG: protein kinase [Anaerolineales bacterium]|jgi:serine/threonine protein kinase|nr:protein kinase [Anaerolineales bacterium]